MAYDSDFARSAVDDLDKLIKHNRALATQLVTEHIPAITRDPKAVGEKKKGDLSHVRAYAFTFRGVAYRIVYEVDDDHQRVTVIAFGVHDVAYRRARNR
ncbi:MAG: type II toxin-antitoxin system RelE/ParE family toxin [Chloroflexi bacterium]|nr:type II toxin-antitoxin system RelE/ParE family toxin [Chloroflexota bacterium]